MAINQGFDPNFNKNLNITGKLICNVISTIWNLWFNVRNKTCPADHLTNGTKMDISPVGEAKKLTNVTDMEWGASDGVDVEDSTGF